MKKCIHKKESNPKPELLQVVRISELSAVVTTWINWVMLSEQQMTISLSNEEQIIATRWGVVPPDDSFHDQLSPPFFAKQQTQMLNVWLIFAY